MKTWTCLGCDRENPEWTSECDGCGRCSECGEILPTVLSPRETFLLRQPHRRTHLN